MIAVNMHHPDDFQNNSNPNPRKLYLMWHEGHTEGARYIPVVGIDYNGAALSYDREMNDNGPHSTHFGGHDQAATKHICEYASHYLPGTNYHAINPASGKKCVDDPGFLAHIHPRLYGQEQWHQKLIMNQYMGQQQIMTLRIFMQQQPFHCRQRDTMIFTQICTTVFDKRMDIIGMKAGLLLSWTIQPNARRQSTTI